MEQPITPPLRGLARLSPERRREIAALGGKASTGGFRAMSPERRREIAAARGHTGHTWTREEALFWASKGGQAPRRRTTPREAS